MVTLPVLSAIRDRWPDAHVELIGYPHIAELAVEGGLVDRIDSLDRANIAHFFSRSPQFSTEQVEYIRSFELIFSYLHDPNGLVQENLLLAGARQVIYGSPLVQDPVHAVDHLLKPLESLAIYNQGAIPELQIGDAGRDWAKNWLKTRGIEPPFWLLHAGSGSPKKNWPVDRFIQLGEYIANKAGQPVLYLLGEADNEIREQLVGKISSEHLLEGLSLVEVARLCSISRAYIGNDSGITHIASATGIPVVALFGPSATIQWAPRGRHVELIDSESGCMSDISVEMLLDRIGSLF